MKILQICKKFPYPLKDGESIAVNHLSKSLADAGCEVHLLAMNTSKHFVAFSDLPQECAHYTSIHTVKIDNSIKAKDAILNLFSKQSYHISRFVSEDFKKKLIQILEKEQFDIIQLETLYLAPYFETIKMHSNALVVMRAHNIEHEIWDRITQQTTFLPRKYYLNYLSKKLKNFEVNHLNQYDFLVAITKRDLHKFKELGYKNGCIATPVGVDPTNYQADFSVYQKPMSAFFIGSLDWIPNTSGLKWFLNNVWSTIHAQYPHLKFHIAGRKPTQEILEIDAPNVVVHGDIHDAKTYINQHQLMIVPLMSGSGIRVKILEGMALGRVVITTDLGLEGIPAVHKEHILIANTPEEFCKSIEFCIQNPHLAEQIGHNAKTFVFNRFNNNAIAGQLIDAYKKVLSGDHAH